MPDEGRTVRTARADELAALEALYLHLNPSRPVLAPDVARRILAEILARPDMRLFVVELDGALVASCMLVTAPNLMGGGRPYALLENVVTHGDHRRRGHGRAVVEAALDHAWGLGSRQVYLLTSRTDPAVRALYRACGFRPGRKAGYVAEAPD